MQKTSIEWTATQHPDGTVTPGYSSNPLRAIDPVTGKRGWACTKVSAGCDHCYAEALNRRWGTGRAYDRDADAVDWWLNERELEAILRSRATGARVFVGDMTDLFHARVPVQILDRLFAVFALRPDLTFQLLTKRPQRAAHYLGDPTTPERVIAGPEDASLGTLAEFARKGVAAGRFRDASFAVGALARWPLANVWLGTSVEDRRVCHRIDALRRCQAAVRFLSCEPLLGPLDLDLRDIDWVITGGESGHGHRPCDPDWVRAIRDQCLAAGVAYFHKQWGGKTPEAGGRLLDGRTWDEFPAVTGAGRSREDRAPGEGGAMTHPIGRRALLDSAREHHRYAKLRATSARRMLRWVAGPHCASPPETVAMAERAYREAMAEEREARERLATYEREP